MHRVKLDPQGYYRRVPLAPHQLQDRVTRTEDAIVLCHVGVPRLDREEWSLTIDGLVERHATLRFGDLSRYPKVELTSIHQCSGSPLQPFEPTRRICNVTWAGARLGDVLADCRPGAAATFLWSYGADSGELGGVVIEPYLKDLPLDRVAADVLIAYEMNGAPLAAEHGFPARLVVPGYYGTNSVKWLTRLTLADRRATGPVTTTWYNDPVFDGSGNPTGETTPVWSIAPESLIVAPAPDSSVARGTEIEILGLGMGGRRHRCRRHQYGSGEDLDGGRRRAAARARVATLFAAVDANGQRSPHAVLARDLMRRRVPAAGRPPQCRASRPGHHRLTAPRSGTVTPSGSSPPPPLWSTWRRRQQHGRGSPPGWLGALRGAQALDQGGNSSAVPVSVAAPASAAHMMASSIRLPAICSAWLPGTGFEPATLRETTACSATELPGTMSF